MSLSRDGVLGCTLVAVAFLLHGCDVMQLFNLKHNDSCEEVKITNGKISTATPGSSAPVVCDKDYEYKGDPIRCNWIRQVCVKLPPSCQSSAPAPGPGRLLAPSAGPAPGPAASGPSGATKKTDKGAKKAAPSCKPNCVDQYGFQTKKRQDSRPEKLSQAQTVYVSDASKLPKKASALEQLKAKTTRRLLAKLDAIQAGMKDLPKCVPKAKSAPSPSASKSASKSSAPAPSGGGKEAPAPGPAGKKARLYADQSISDEAKTVGVGFLPGLFIGALVVGGLAVVFRKFRTRRVDAETELSDEFNGNASDDALE